MLSVSPPGGDDARVQSGEVETAGEACVFDLRAAIHHDVEARCARDLRVPDAE